MLLGNYFHKINKNYKNFSFSGISFNTKSIKKNNIFFAILIIFIILYILLNWFAKTSTKKISKFVRTFIIISSILLAVIMAYAGRYIFSLPFMLAILPLIKTKAGISLFQLFRLWGLFRVLKNSGRFNFNQLKIISKFIR